MSLILPLNQTGFGTGADPALYVNFFVADVQAWYNELTGNAAGQYEVPDADLVTAGLAAGNHPYVTRYGDKDAPLVSDAKYADGYYLFDGTTGVESTTIVGITQAASNILLDKVAPHYTWRVTRRRDGVVDSVPTITLARGDTKRLMGWDCTELIGEDGKITSMSLPTTTSSGISFASAGTEYGHDRTHAKFMISIDSSVTIAEHTIRATITTTPGGGVAQLKGTIKVNE